MIPARYIHIPTYTNVYLHIVANTYPYLPTIKWLRAYKTQHKLSGF